MRGWESHDVLGVIARVKREPGTTRKQLEEDMASQGQTRGRRERGLVNVAVKLMLMVDCSPPDYSSDKLETGAFQASWSDDVAFSKFVQDAFSLGNHPALSYPSNPEYYDVKDELLATKLKEVLDVRLLPTDDLRNHLKLDRRRNSLSIFHHVGFLKEQLRLTKQIRQDASIHDGLRL
jgi:hypothetical protein